MKKNTAIRLACRNAQLDLLRVLLPVIPDPVMVQENGTIILSNPSWDAHEDQDLSRMKKMVISGNEGEDLFSIFVLQSGKTISPGLDTWERSAKELKDALSSLVEGWRTPLSTPKDDDPLADVKREYNAALETIERLISVSRLF